MEYDECFLCSWHRVSSLGNCLWFIWVRHVLQGFELSFLMSIGRKDGVEKELGIISREKTVMSLTNKRLTC